MDFNRYKETRQEELLRHIFEVTRWADIDAPQWSHIVVDSISSWTECKTSFAIVNQARYYFMLDLLKYIWKDDYLFKCWYRKKEEEQFKFKEIKLEIADDIKEMMYAILEDQGCSWQDINETFYDYSD